MLGRVLETGEKFCNKDRVAGFSFENLHFSGRDSYDITTGLVVCDRTTTPNPTTPNPKQNCKLQSF